MDNYTYLLISISLNQIEIIQDLLKNKYLICNIQNIYKFIDNKKGG